MDAYDHVAQASIRSSALPLDTPTPSGATTPNTQNTSAAKPAPSSSTSTPSASLQPPEFTATGPGTLSDDLREAYTSFSSSEWGARLGGFWGTVRKSGESVISGVKNEASIASEEALRGFGELKREIAEIGSGVVRSRGMTLTATNPGTSTAGEKTMGEKEEKKETDANADAALADTDGFVARFRAEAERRLKDIQKAEDAADEALLRFGSNIRSFLRDAVSVSAPEAGQGSTDQQQSQLLFESKDADGKRVIHTSRFDAQLHVIHSSLDGFLKDPPDSAEYATWSKDFDVGKHTEDITTNLQKYEELRRAMEKLVPESVDYNTFWTRYYYLRLVVESEEKRRKEMLKRATLKSEEEEVGWDEDSDEEPGTPQPRSKAGAGLQETEPRKSGDQHSQPDSDASYDLVSGATSHTPSSPKEEKDRDTEKTLGEKKLATSTGDSAKKEDSDEEDWE